MGLLIRTKFSYIPFFTHTFQQSVYDYIYIVILTTLFWYNQHIPELYSCTISMPRRFCCVHTTDRREKVTVESMNYLTLLPTELQTSTNHISPVSCSMHVFSIAQNNGCIYWITEYELVHELLSRFRFLIEASNCHCLNRIPVVERICGKHLGRLHGLPQRTNS